jgi:hypothetical protein
MGAMKELNIAQFASELGLPVALLLEQLRAAGIAKELESDPMSEQDKAKLLEHLRQAHGAGKPAKKTKLIRRETTEVKKADSSGRALVQTSIAGVGAPLKELEVNKEVVTPVKHKRQLKVDHYFSKVKKLLPEHPNESLNNMRKAVEAICKDILDETYEKKDEGKVLKPASAFSSLEDMTQELKRRKQLPVAIEKYLAALQQYGNFGSHDQDPDKEDITCEISASIMAKSSLLPLQAIVDWYKAFDLSAHPTI